MLGASIGSIF
jgi:hypothetical protein